MGFDPITLAVIGIGSQLGSSFLEGSAEKQELKGKANESYLQATKVGLDASTEELDRQERLRGIISTQNAMFASAGIGFGGTAETLASSSISQAARESRQSRTISDINISILEEKGRNFNKASSNAISKSLISGALKVGASAGTAFAETGSVPKTP